MNYNRSSYILFKPFFYNFPNNNNIFFGGDVNINICNHIHNSLIQYLVDYIYFII